LVFSNFAGKKFKTINPVNGKVIAEVSEGFKEDVDAAAECAQRAFNPKSEWRKITPYGRGRLLSRLADRIESDMQYICVSRK
jgi:acyl-CoA reductase-like NAD-dependent aldehyde dehydrogenase